MRRAITRSGLVLALAAGVGGCIPWAWQALQNPFLFLMYMTLYGGDLPYDTVSAKPFKTATEVEVTGTVGGLDGAYDLTFLGQTFTGTAKVKRQRFVTVNAKDSPELRAAVAAFVSSGIAGDEVTITRATGKIKAHQQPGGTQVVATAKFSFRGTIDTGEVAGRRIRGTIRGGAKDPPDEE
jgi:hypothetical protein